MFINKVNSVKQQVKFRLTKKAISTLDMAWRRYCAENNLYNLSRSDFLDKVILDTFNNNGTRKYK